MSLGRMSLGTSPGVGACVGRVPLIGHLPIGEVDTVSADIRKLAAMTSRASGAPEASAE